MPLIEEEIDGLSGLLFPFYDADTHMLYLAGKVVEDGGWETGAACGRPHPHCAPAPALPPKESQAILSGLPLRLSLPAFQTCPRVCHSFLLKGQCLGMTSEEQWGRVYTGIRIRARSVEDSDSWGHLRRLTGTLWQMWPHVSEVLSPHMAPQPPHPSQCPVVASPGSRGQVSLVF